ncbi:hypothetical protein KM043_013689 [Ampulex compressa]|nr:hypothetical protein KM043_013689 [Ampulex compressa]
MVDADRRLTADALLDFLVDLRSWETEYGVGKFAGIIRTGDPRWLEESKGKAGSRKEHSDNEEAPIADVIFVPG